MTEIPWSAEEQYHRYSGDKTVTSFALKIIAAVTMLIDHTGYILFPSLSILRIIGRLSFPIYAFCIAEGFRYTKDKKKYFLRVFLLGLLCQIVFFIVQKDIYLGILIVYSFSMILMFLIDIMKDQIKKNSEKGKKQYSAIAVLLLILSLTLGLFFFCRAVSVDYGFFGIMLPVFVYVFDDLRLRKISFSVGLLLLCVYEWVFARYPLQMWAMMTIPLIIMYNGQRGPRGWKYFFYVFYPVHFAVLYLIDLII